MNINAWGFLLFSPAAFSLSLETTLTASTDYVYRGISQSNGNPVLQISPELMLGEGLHLVGFASPVDFGGNSSATLEYDTAIGYEKKGEDSYWNIRLWRFNYRDQKELATTELRIFGQYKYLDFTYGYSPNFFNSNAEANHFEVGSTLPLNKQLSLRGHLGYSDFSDNPFYKDFYHFKLSLLYRAGTNTLELAHTKTIHATFGELGGDRTFLCYSHVF